MSRDHYEVLEVEPGATKRQIRDAYERAVRLIEGEDVAGYLMLDEAGQRDLRGEIEEAYAVLSDPGRRAQFDASIGTDPPKPKKPLMRFLRPIEANAEAPPPRPKQASVAPAPASVAERPASAEAPGPSPKPAPSAEEPEPIVAAVEEQTINGAYLRELREAKGLSVAELSKRTRVPKNYIEAMEAEDHDAMPKRVFVRGFLTQIARQVGVERARLADGYVRTVLKD